MHSTTPVALAGDIGGTRTRFALCDLDGSNIGEMTSLTTKEFPSIDAALRAYLAEAGVSPQVVSLAVAAPLTGPTIQLTNADWTFCADDVKRATGAARVQILNDFAALARALPKLADADLRTVSPGERDPAAPNLVIGPGTGFGAATFVRSAAGWVSVPGEGGHMTFGACDADDRLVVEFLARRHGHVSVERVLSGSGIEAIHAAFTDASAPAAEIVSRVLAGSDADARRTIDYFVRTLARVAGDMALMVGARGGIYLGGGIAPRLVDAIDSDAFRAAFCDKGRMSHYLARVPIHVIMAPDAGLRGAAAALVDLMTDADRAGWAHV